MIDPAVVVAALLLLPLVLLFRFVGCDAVFKLTPVPHKLSITARVPTALTVTEVRYQVTRPNGVLNTVTVPAPAPSTTADGENIFTNSDEDPTNGAWMIRVRVQVTDVNGLADSDQGTGNFMLDGTIEAPKATFQASGTPTDGNFNVGFVGLS